MQPEGDLWDHTMLVLDLLPADPSFTLAFAALLHDVRQARDQRRAPAAATPFMSTSRQRPGLPSDSAIRSSFPMPSASGSPGSSPTTNTWEKPQASASRSSSGSWRIRGSKICLPCTEADALASFGQSEDVDYLPPILSSSQPAGPINPPPLVNGHDLVSTGWSQALVRDPSRTASRRPARGRDPQQARSARVGRPPARGRRESMRPDAPEPDSSEERLSRCRNQLDRRSRCLDQRRTRQCHPLRGAAPRLSPGRPALHPQRARWEDAELSALRQFLDAVKRDGLKSLVVLDEPIADVYGTHWSTRGASVPGSETPDEAVYLPGRNLLLTVKAAVWCRLREIENLALGSLGSNPFPTARPTSFETSRDS